ncbi:MAG: VCBS repeat-containing protein, partial [Nitrospirae bacterium]|nr:VCBS repeat-containing protein [Nitrospirota bacterium]
EGRKIGSDLVLPEGTVCPPENVSFDNICIRGSIYYNSPGGVPDFSNNKGTSVAGSYTVFNLPPGDVYLWASRGGRGNGRIKVFADKISVGKLQVVPISISTAGVTGSVIEAKDESTAVPQATLTILGTNDPGLRTTSDANGLYSLVSIGTNGNYLIKVSKAGHWDSYQSLNTTPFQAASNIQDVTRTVESYSSSYVAEIGSRGGVSVNPNLGIITGRIKAGDGTPQHCAKISVRDRNGNDLVASGGAVLVYVDGSRGSCADPTDKNQTATNGLFFIYNLPEGELSVNYLSSVATGAGATVSVSSGGVVAPSFPGVVFVQDIFNTGSGLSQALSGIVTDEGDHQSTDVRLTFLGVPPRTYPYNQNGQNTFDLVSDAKSDSSAKYTIPQNSDSNDRYPLIGGIPYRVKLSKAGFPDTYQIVNMLDKETKQNLLILSTSGITDSSKGEVFGILTDQTTGQTAQNVTLRVTDLNGNPLAGGEVTSADGTFRVSNLPKGIINLSVVSGDDSGNTTVQVFENGVTYLEFGMTKVIPAQISVSGSVTDLAAASVDQSRLKILGRNDVVSVAGNGTYQGNLETFGRFIIKAEKEGFHDTYNFFPRSGVINTLTSLDLFSVSRSQTDTAAAETGVSLDRTKGIITGTTVRSSFMQKICGTCLATDTHAAALGYFNKDTFVDVAVTNKTAGTVTLLFGVGDENGSFVNTKPPLTIGGNPTGIAVGDFDGNGSADLAVVYQGGNVNDPMLAIFLGDKNGNFTPVASPIVNADPQPQPLAPSPLNNPVALAVGFFDSDNIADLAIVNEGDNSVIVLLGNGNGSFHPIYQNSSIVRHGVESSPKAIVAGDFNQDQRLDMAISNSGSGTITVLLGSTDGTFQPLSDPNTGSPLVIAAGTDPEAMTLADFNSDGRLDLAVLNKSQNSLTILAGNTSGGFDRLTDANHNSIPSIPVGNNPSSISIGEFNGDGRIDLAVVNQGDSTLLPLFGNGDGTFTAATPLLLGDTDGDGTREVNFTAPQAVMISDLDRDGFFDLTVIGSHVANLLGRENSTGGVSVEARDLEGTRVGTVRYLDAGGHVLPNATTTTSNGKFMILNVPPGILIVRSTGGGSGNSIVDVYADAVSYTKLRSISLQPFFIPISGVTYDPVGPPPAGVPVGLVNIQLLGMDVQTRSDRMTGNYSFNVDANGEYIIRLFWDLSR